MTEQQITLAISIGGTIFGVLLGTFLGFILNLLNSNRIEKKHENKDSLKEHFDDLNKGVLIPIHKVLAKTNNWDGNIVCSCWEEIKNIQAEQLICFKAHYPKLMDKWIELVGEYKEKSLSINGIVKTQNETANAFEKKIYNFIKEQKDKDGITLPIGPFTSQELINEAVVETITNSIYSQIADGKIEHDFTKALILETGDGHFVLSESSATYVIGKNRSDIEKCKSIFISIQTDGFLRKEASFILESAKQIASDVELIKIELERIQSRGLITNNKKYTFKPIKQCHICVEYFYTK